MSSEIPHDFTPDSAGELQVDLEKHFIAEFLNLKGYTETTLNKLPKDEAHRLMIEASTYASGKFAEMESRERFTKNLKGVGHNEVS